MASVFLSHSSRDRTVTEWVGERLRIAGFVGLFIDFDPVQGIPAGRNWERELYTQLRRADAVIFLASESSVNSPWCVAEISLARSLGRPVFPLRLDPGVDLPLLTDVRWLGMTDGKPDLVGLLADLRAAGLDPSDTFAWDPTRAPYPGLGSVRARGRSGVFRTRAGNRSVVGVAPTDASAGIGPMAGRSRTIGQRQVLVVACWAAAPTESDA